MFELEQAIANWRRQMKDAGIKSRSLLAELEAHLREDINRKSKSDFSLQQAFECATATLGNAASLRAEFQKASRASSWPEKVMLAISGVLIGFILFLSAVTIFLCYSGWGERIVASAAVVSILLVARSWSYTVQFLPFIHSAPRRWVAGLGCIGTGFLVSNLFCAIILPHFERGADGQLPALGVWAVFFLAAFFCTGVGLLLSKREREQCGPETPGLKRFVKP